MLNKFKGKEIKLSTGTAMDMLEKLRRWTDEQMYPGAPSNLIVILDAEKETAVIDGKVIIGIEEIMTRLSKPVVQDVIDQPFIRLGGWINPADPPESDLEKYVKSGNDDFSIWNVELLKVVYTVWGMLLTKKPNTIYWIEYEGESEMMGAEEFNKNDLDSIQKFMNMSKWGDENKDFDLEEEE